MDTVKSAGYTSKGYGQENERRGTVLSGFSVITKSMIGSGIFSMSCACGKFGILAGVFFLLLAAGITWLSLRVLSILALEYRNETPTFYSVSEKIMPRARWVVDAALVINCLGAAIVYVQTAGNLMAQASTSIFPSPMAENHVALIVEAIMVVGLAPLCMMKEISATKIPNLVGLSCLLYIVICTFFYTNTEQATSSLLYPVDPLIALGSFPTFIFAFACQQNMFTVANELQNATPKRLNAVSIASTLTGLIVYMPMMILPFLTFGRNIKSNYLYNMESGEVPIKIAYVLASISVSISFVLQVHPVRRSIISLVYGSKPPRGKKELSLRIAFVTAILLV